MIKLVISELVILHSSKEVPFCQTRLHLSLVEKTSFARLMAPDGFENTDTERKTKEKEKEKEKEKVQ